MYPNTRTYQPSQPDGDRPRLYLAGAVLDAACTCHAPGGLLIHRGVVLAAGDAQKLLEEHGSNAQVIRRPDRLLIPGLVNAHAHLDLTHVGHRPFDGSFINWVKMVIAARPRDDAAVASAVRDGAALSLQAGVFTVGDIAGSPAATAALQSTGMRGVSFAELLGDASAAMERLYAWPGQIDDDLRVGIQPHAPYSTRREVYQTAAAMEVPWLSTHLAETPEESRFVAAADGPWRDMLTALGKWTDTAASQYGHDESPVEWLLHTLGLTPSPSQGEGRGEGRSSESLMAQSEPTTSPSLPPSPSLSPQGERSRMTPSPYQGEGRGEGRNSESPIAQSEPTTTPSLPPSPGLFPQGERSQRGTPRRPWLVAHCNYVTDADIAAMAAHGWSVAYCPRASDYFGHRGHRYRDMLAAGLNVCLGTDSIICHGSLSILDEMRHLHQRDGVDARLLLRMATVNGMHALGRCALDATFVPGASPGVIGLHYHGPSAAAALEAVLAGRASADIEIIERPGALRAAAP